jgi:hypothetical protein
MKKSTLFLAGMAALLLSFGLILMGCSTDSDDPSGGGDKKTDLVGTWVKEGESADEKMEYKGGGGSNDPLYFKNKAGSTLWSGQMVSYDGTTATVGDDHNGYDPKSITFTAVITGKKLKISGLTGKLEPFNGTYAKEGSGSGGQNPFKGTWVNSNYGWTMVFTDSDFTLTDSDAPTFGTYTYTGNTATGTEDASTEHAGETHTWTITNNSFTWFGALFTKQ